VAAVFGDGCGELFCVYENKKKNRTPRTPCRLRRLKRKQSHGSEILAVPVRLQSDRPVTKADAGEINQYIRMTTRDTQNVNPRRTIQKVGPADERRTEVSESYLLEAAQSVQLAPESPPAEVSSDGAGQADGR